MSDKTASLTVLGGPLAGTHCALPEGGTVTIGSAPGSTLYLDLPAVSPYHARVVVEGGRITVHDTGSARTVHVNDNPLEREGTELRNGDILWLGVPGEEDVVMMQCVLPRRTPTSPTEAAPPPPSSPEPTPEIETVALWAKDSAGEQAREAVEAAERAVSDDAQGYAGASEVEHAEQEAIAEARAELVSETPAHEPVSFVDDYAGAAAAEALPEPEAHAASGPDGDVVTEGVEEVAPTLLMGSADEVAGVVEPASAPDAEFESYQSFVTEAEPEPVVLASPVVEPAPAPPPPPPSEPRPRPARPAAPRAAAPSASQRTRPAPARAAEPAVAAPLEHVASRPARSGLPMLLIGGAAVAVLVLAVGGYFAWRALGQRVPAPTPTPAPVARASEPPPPPVATPEPTRATPAPIEAATPTPAPLPTATPATSATPAAAATPSPRATPTPRPTATPAATPPPAATGPSPEQQRAQQVAALVSQAEAAIGSRQYDAALGQLDNALKLEPGNAKASSLRADAAQRRDLARRRFVPGRTVVDSEKTRKDKASGGLVGFDADEKAPDFTGRIEFEMTPAGPVEPNDAWTLKVFVVNQGKKAIKVQGLTIAATINGAGASSPLNPSVREIAPQQRVQVGETTGNWREGTTSWVAQATLTAPKNETLSNTLSWK